MDLSYSLFWFSPPTLHQELFSWLLRCLNMSDGPRMGWYDSIIVRGGQDFKVQGDLREYLRDYFMELKVFRWTQEEVI